METVFIASYNSQYYLWHGRSLNCFFVVVFIIHNIISLGTYVIIDCYHIDNVPHHCIYFFWVQKKFNIFFLYLFVKLLVFIFTHEHCLQS